MNKRILQNIILFLFSLFFILLVLEFALRAIGRKPSYVPRYSNFEPVDSLIVYEQFYTDDEGVFKADPNWNWHKEYALNSDGFRSKEFSFVQSDSLKIMFLGDSFTWGASAEPITDCFVDRISRQGVITYNTGIPGTGPSQYAVLAQKYIPLLKPDLVCVMFYLGNDFSIDQMQPDKNPYHITNAGWISAFDDQNQYMLPKQAYEYHIQQNNLANIESDFFTNILKKSSVGTLVLAVVVKTRLILSGENRVDEGEIRKQKVKTLLNDIKETAEYHQTDFFLFLIPVHPEKRNSWNRVKENLELFKNLEPFYPTNLEKDDYVPLPNGHLNNSGHEKYARFILKNLPEKSNSR